MSIKHGVAGIQRKCEMEGACLTAFVIARSNATKQSIFVAQWIASLRSQ